MEILSSECPPLYIENASMGNTVDSRFDFDKEITPAAEDARARVACTPDKYRHAITAAMHILAIVANADNLDGMGKGLINDIDQKLAPNLAKQFMNTVDKKYLAGIQREDEECDTVYKYMN